MSKPDKEITYYFNIEYEKVLTTLAVQYNNTQPENIAPLIEQIKVLEKFAITNERIFVLFSQTKFYPLYISENINKIGYTQKEVLTMSLREAFKFVYWKQFFLGIKVHQWGNSFRKLTGGKTTINHKAFYCGIVLKNKLGNPIKTLIKQKFISVNEKGMPLLSFLEVEDIGPHFKADFCWCRMTNGNAKFPVNRVYLSSGSKKEYPDLLSQREMEILQLIINNKDSAAIAASLSISVETVKKHRKNMIARVGAKDMTSLIYLCRLCDLI